MSKVYDIFNTKALRRTIGQTLKSIHQHSIELKVLLSSVRSDLLDTNTRVSKTESDISRILGDGEGSIKYEVAKAVASMLDMSPEDLATLRELSEWKSEHEDLAQLLEQSIIRNQENIRDNSSDIAVLKSGYKGLRYDVDNLYILDGDSEIMFIFPGGVKGDNSDSEDDNNKDKDNRPKLPDGYSYIELLDSGDLIMVEDDYIAVKTD